jgi:regulator of protease activity HflC (stomatin/prohibitin superfamily)
VSVENAVDLSGLAREIDPYWAEEDRQKAEAKREAQRILAEERAKAGIPPPPPKIFKERKSSNTAASNNSTQEPQQPKAALVGLARLADRYLSLELVKNKRVSRSNWELPLTQGQLECTLFRSLGVKD